MKHLTLIFLSILAFRSTEAFRPRGPLQPQNTDSSNVSSMSSEESSSDEILNGSEQQRKVVRPDTMIQSQQYKNDPVKNLNKDKKKEFFDRPSSEQLEAYDDKVRNQKKGRLNKDKSVMVQKPVDLELPRVKPVKPMKPKMDDGDEQLFLTALGQIYLDKLDERSEVFPGPPGPIGPMMPPQPPFDYDYMFGPAEVPVKAEANNNGNNNVHVNVNHVEVNSKVLHVPEKDRRNNFEKHEEVAPVIPVQQYLDPAPTSQSSQYLYFNFNVADAFIMAILAAVFVFATKKAYTKCFPKKSLVNQLPTTLPPTYAPSTVVVETVPKKIAQ